MLQKSKNKQTNQLVKKSKMFQKLEQFAQRMISFSVCVDISTVKIESLIFRKGRSSSIGAYKKAISSGGESIILLSLLLSRARDNERIHWHLELLSWSYIYPFFCLNRKWISLLQCQLYPSASKKTQHIYSASIHPSSHHKEITQ